MPKQVTIHIYTHICIIWIIYIYIYVCVFAFKTACFKGFMETTDVPSNHVTSPYINRTGK